MRKEEESGEENEEYKEDPWYHPNTLSISTQLDKYSTPALTSDADANPDPERAIDNRKESKRELRYQIENKVLQRLFRPRPLANTTTQADKETQESSSVEQSSPTVNIHEWGQTRQKTLQKHNEKWQVWKETNVHEAMAAYLEKRRSTTIRARCTGEGIRTGEQGCSLEEGAVDKLLVGELGG